MVGSSPRRIDEALQNGEPCGRDAYPKLTLPIDATIRKSFGGPNFRAAKAALKLSPRTASKAISQALQELMREPDARWLTSHSAKHRVLEVPSLSLSLLLFLRDWILT